ncbi:hypothetical protein KM043_010132 [Ampulex compressa]|nr:hypothetical protein KM043_010132 [Ampulex compressa]
MAMYIISSFIVILASSQDRANCQDLQLPMAKRDSSLFSTRQMDNLKRALDYIRDSREFQPLTFSVILAEDHSSIADFLFAYMAENSINAYKVRANDFAFKCTWKYQIGLTWVFFIDDVRTLWSFIYLQPDLWISVNQYVIIVTNEKAIVPWRKIFEYLWFKYDVFKVIFIAMRDDFQCLLGYLPFNLIEGKYGGVRRLCFSRQTRDRELERSGRGKADSSGFEDVDRVSFMSKRKRLFESFNNMNGYPMNITVFDSLMMNVSFDEQHRAKFSRLDADVMAVLEKVMKVKFLRKILNRSTNDDPFHKTLKYIENGEAEMIVTGFFTKRYSAYRKYEFTAGVYEDRLCFIAPAAGLIPRSYMPIIPFSIELWLLLAVYNVLISILWFLVKYYSRSFHRQRRLLLPLSLIATDNSSSSLLIQGNTSSTQTNSSLASENRSSQPRTISNPLELSKENRVQPPEINAHLLACFDLVETSCYPLQDADTAAQRAFLCGTLFFGLIVTGLYQSCLVSSLSKPPHFPDLETLEDVANSNLSIVTKYWNLKLNTFTEDTSLGMRLSRKIEVVSSDKPTNHMVAYKKNVIALGRYSSVKLENLTAYYDKDGNDLLHIVEECPATYMISYVLRLYSPYRERINELLLRMQGAGLVGLWFRETIHHHEAEEQRRKVARNERKIKLTLEHYLLTFLGLFLGLLCSTVVFLVELYFSQRLDCWFECAKV